MFFLQTWISDIVKINSTNFRDALFLIYTVRGRSVSKRWRNGPWNSQIKPVLTRIGEGGEMIDSAVSTRGIIAQLGDIATMGSSSSEQQARAESSGLIPTITRSQPTRTVSV